MAAQQTGSIDASTKPSIFFKATYAFEAPAWINHRRWI